MTLFSDDQRATLTLICDTFVPALSESDSPLMTTSAGDVGLADWLETALERVAGDTDRTALKTTLSLLENSLFNRRTVRIAKPFSAMTRDERETLLRAWSASDIAQARQIFQSLKRLALFIFYSVMPDGEPNPAWSAINYRLPEPQQHDTPRPIQPFQIAADTALTCDALIIGSGAGGGVVAGELAAAGMDVIVVEKGEYWSDSDFHGRELESTERLFEKFGALTSSDKAISILAGSVLGGGTTINWAASFRTPDSVLAEWEKLGFSGATSNAYAASLDSVIARLNVNSESPLNALNVAFRDGCKKLGYDAAIAPRNVKDCEDCGFCNYGCRFGAKQGTLKTYLQDAYDHGARIIVRGHVNRLLIEHETARGAQVTVTGEDRAAHAVNIHAKVVIVAAGAIHSPALLLRSGLGNRHIGANLRLHPTSPIYGIFDHPMRGWQGVPLGLVSSEFADLDGAGYGVRLETAPVHPGIAALTLAWESGTQHKQTMAQLENLATIIILTRDRFGGRVTVDRRGQPVIQYHLHPHDAGHLQQGILAALRVHHAAGAREVASPHTRHTFYRADQGRSFEEFLGAVKEQGLRPNSFSLFSAHQMASCRIGGNSAHGALKPNGETYEVRNLFVADASAMPTCTGVNPMISIMGLAHYLAQGIKARYG
jgi:choline dehydrogenase-like flavoprotein